MKSKRSLLNKYITATNNKVINILLWSSAIFFLFPLIWMFTGSFKLQSAAIKIPPEIIPKNPTLLNFINLFEKAPIERWFINSFSVALISALAVCIVGSLAGYAFAKKRFIGNNFLFWIILGSMMIPRQLLIIPLFRIMMQLGLINNLLALVLPVIAWPFSVFLMKQFIKTIPNEILEAGKIDGCSELRLFTSVVFPLIKPGLGALAIFTFTDVWNDYLWQLVIISERNKFTMPVGIATFKSQYYGEYGLQMAGAVVAILPMLTIFLVFQQYFVKGITLGAVKG